jgi:Lipid A 3-O-deacylase (PagL)
VTSVTERAGSTSVSVYSCCDESEYAAATLIAIHCATLGAQPTRPLLRGERFVGASAATSVYTDVGAHFAEIRERNMFAASLRAEWVLENAGPLAVSSTMELIPLALVSRRAGSVRDCWPEPSGNVHCQAGSNEPTYGSGLLPFGVKFYAFNGARARFFASAATGLMVFSRDMPVTRSRRLNFTAEYGGGAEITTMGGGAVVVGWKFQHMSNAYTAPENPGLDLNMFYLGVLRRRR